VRGLLTDAGHQQAQESQAEVRLAQETRYQAASVGHPRELGHQEQQMDQQGRDQAARQVPWGLVQSQGRRKQAQPLASKALQPLVAFLRVALRYQVA
jgi:hypothetical protein